MHPAGGARIKISVPNFRSLSPKILERENLDNSISQFSKRICRKSEKGVAIYNVNVSLKILTLATA